MHGLMMDMPLLIPSLIRHGAQCHGSVEIVSQTVEGPIHRYTYADAYARIRRLANALAALGVGPCPLYRTVSAPRCADGPRAPERSVRSG